MQLRQNRVIPAAIRIGTAMVWLVFGLLFKVLDLVPRHRVIVASIVGEELARSVTIVVGCAEAGLAVWILSARSPRLCAATQTVVIATMNGLELSLAREHLLAPIPMLIANAAFLSLVWYGALNVPTGRGTS